MNVRLSVAEDQDAASLPADMAYTSGEDAESVFAVFCFPQLRHWLPLIRHLPCSLADLVQAAARSEANGSDIASELISGGVVDEVGLYRALADCAGLRFLPAVDHNRLLISEEGMSVLLSRSEGVAPVKMQGGNGEIFLLIAPEGCCPTRLSGLVRRYPGIADRLWVTTPRALRRAIVRRSETTLMRSAVVGLFDRNPDLSARLVLHAWQGGVCGALIMALPIAFALEPAGTFLAIHCVSTCFFLACVGLRLAVLASMPRIRPALGSRVSSPDLPVYSVLVALYKEAAVASELLASLDRLDWPRTKLQVLLVCERDDQETIAAVRAACPGPHVEIVEVPSGGPRTKPKALSYALRMAKGKFVVLYDAEDEPHPGQLFEAWRRFDTGPSNLACLQAPLEISNPGDSLVARMFAFEYRALFGGLLPWLAHRRFLLPLGGTSNHFRRSALEEVCGWDPFNVTEDADLGLRLARFGYQTDMLTLPTREAAPLTLKVWRPQRTRWLKGWLQTWLVHMRQPFRLARELGPGSFLTAQILLAGMVVSAIVHPLLIVTIVAIGFQFAMGWTSGDGQSILLIADTVSVTCGYLSFLLLGYQASARAERRGAWKVVLFTPFYWLMISLAAWSAVRQLWRRPHHWDKTPHLRRTASSEQASVAATS